MKKVIIIGAGITGLITALKLYKEYKVTVIDAGPHPKYVDNKLPVIVAVGHAAGGFTQAPHTADAIKKQLDIIQAKL